MTPIETRIESERALRDANIDFARLAAGTGNRIRDAFLVGSGLWLETARLHIRIARQANWRVVKLRRVARELAPKPIFCPSFFDTSWWQS